MVIGAVLLAILAGIGIGVAVYNAGLDQGVAEGLRQSGQDAQAVRVIGPRYGHGYGYGWGFFPFGLILFPLLVIGWADPAQKRESVNATVHATCHLA